MLGLALAFLGWAVQGRLLGADVQIHLRDGGATVEARYRIETGSRPVEFVALRFPGQAVSLLAPAAGLRLRAEAGLTRIRAAGGRAGEWSLAYRVSGTPERIPIFVPEGPPAAGSPVEIRVRWEAGSGAAARVVLGESFPRFVALPDGTLRARPGNLPSFVRLSRSDGSIPFHRAFDTLVVVVVALGAGYWFRGRRRRRRAPGS
ncbi:MAG: hypothetical protein ACE5HQ_06265 [Gemmatimonadota bacterium]